MSACFAAVVPCGGGVLSLPPACPAFSFLLCPYPPAPLPLRGRGRFIVILCKGLRPRHPGLNLRGTGVGASPVRSGRLAPASSARRALSFAFAPYPPDPLPRRGRGRFIVILCKGLRPLHPRGLNPGGTGGRGRTTRSVGGVLSLFPVATAFNWFSCPLSPQPPSPSGEGGDL